MRRRVCNVDLSNSRIDIVNNYHARMLSCAVIVASTPELELVQMGSFGCGHDADHTDEIARMMGEMGSKVPMMIKLMSDVAVSMGIAPFVDRVGQPSSRGGACRGRPGARGPSARRPV